MTEPTLAASTRMWLELAGPDSAPEWVLLTRDHQGQSRVIASMPAPPVQGRSPHHLLTHDRMDVWVARQIHATDVVLRRSERDGKPTWYVDQSHRR